MAQKTASKIQLIHPEGKNAPAISKETYDLFETAIVDTFQMSQPLTYTEIAKGVDDYFLKNKVSFNGSVSWYTVSVKMHLEATGILESYLEKGKKLHRLKH